MKREPLLAGGNMMRGKLHVLFLLYSSHSPIGPQPYPVIYVVANPVRGHIEVSRSTGHIMATTRYSDQQGSKSRQKVMRLYKQWPDQSQNGSSNLLSPYREQPRSTWIVVAYPRPAFSATKRTNYAPTSFVQQVQVFKATHRTKIREIEIPRSMVVEALSW